jgi:hypothetical protein
MDEDSRIKKEIEKIVTIRINDILLDIPMENWGCDPRIRTKLEELELDLNEAYQSMLPPNTHLGLSITGSSLQINWVTVT